MVEQNKSWIRFAWLCNKIWRKKITDVDTSDFAKKGDLASLKSEVDKLDIDKFQAVPTDLSKLSNVADTDVVKKSVYNKLFKKVNAIDPGKLVKKTDYDTKLKKLENT